jgi:hypothetical protein
LDRDFYRTLALRSRSSKPAQVNVDNDDMDLVAAVSDMQQMRTISQVQIAVAGKVMDMQRMQGAAAIKLLNAAAEGVNKAGDQLVAAATGLGGNIDVHG